MRKQDPLFKSAAFMLLISIAMPVSAVFAETASSHPSFAKRKAGLYQDMFDQLVYYQATQYLHLDRLYRALSGSEKPALNVNAYDEVPDSTFFTNRHGRERMSIDALTQGPSVTEGPDRSGPWTITRGKFEGISPGFFIRDARGGKYLIKFDPLDYLELPSGAEVIASRFLHAIGYNVPQYTIETFNKKIFSIGPEAKVYDETGFQKPLDPDLLEQFLLFAPEIKEGTYRVSASRILEGKVLGPMNFKGRRGNDPDDPYPHEDRREIRALQVFSSWLNNYDTRDSNTLDILESGEENPVIRHYLIDFNSALGARPAGPKPPMFGHEHLFDYGETTKAYFRFGFGEKIWQKRWREAGEKIENPSLGYFDNNYFDAGKYKMQFSYFAFDDMTRADAFWAAKILMKFTDEEIRAVVSTGEYADSRTEEEIARVLIERRDLIGRHWFKEANPLDEFKLIDEAGSYEIRFNDLAVHYGFEPQDSRIYLYEVSSSGGKKPKLRISEEAADPVIPLSAEWLQDHSSLEVFIRVSRTQDGPGPWVRLTIESENGRPRLAGIDRQD